ncbi:MAG: phosphotransferase enzyme family protein [Solirubrobacteraceae bacterium]
MISALLMSVFDVTVTPPVLERHLQDRYGIDVSAITALDLAVWRVERRDGPSWVARAFPGAYPLTVLQGDAAILRALERAEFPAERCASTDPVSTLDGQPVLVTEYVTPGPPMKPGRPAAILGALLGRLHNHPGANLRAGGGWHHLAPGGTPRDELAAARARVEDALPRVGVRELPLYHRLRDMIEEADDCDDLPHAFVHPDFAPANAIPTPDDRLVIVDWAGAGRGPRLPSLGFLLWAAGARSPKLIDVVVSRYARQITLEPDELARLSSAIHLRPLTLECWSLWAGRRALADAVARIEDAHRLADRIAETARQAYTPT